MALTKTIQICVEEAEYTKLVGAARNANKSISEFYKPAVLECAETTPTLADIQRQIVELAAILGVKSA